MDYVALLKEYGTPLAFCVVLLIAIRWVVFQLVNELRNRINTLERISRDQAEQIHGLESDRLSRADLYANSVRELAHRVTITMRENNATTKELIAVIGRWVDRSVPANHHNRHPSSAELPSAPEPDSDTTRYPKSP